MFTTPLILQAYEGHPDLWIIAEPLCWTGGGFPDLTVPKGFVTDLASIPRALRNLPAFDPNGLSRRPAAMHDFLYAWRGVDKGVADAFLRAAMIVEGCSVADADAFYESVHLFGGAAWADDGVKGLEGSFVSPAAYSAWRSVQP